MGQTALLVTAARIRTLGPVWYVTPPSSFYALAGASPALCPDRRNFSTLSISALGGGRWGPLCARMCVVNPLHVCISHNNTQINLIVDISMHSDVQRIDAGAGSSPLAPMIMHTRCHPAGAGLASRGRCLVPQAAKGPCSQICSNITTTTTTTSHSISAACFTMPAQLARPPGRFCQPAQRTFCGRRSRASS